MVGADFLVGALLILSCYAKPAELLEFPKKFLFGTGSSAYQVEGGWNADGKGVSIWDYVAHAFLQGVVDGSDGDVTADTYHKYKGDVQLLKDLGVQHYRFSISWTRVLPNGNTSVINEAGLRYYDNLINELLAHGILPMVTIYHWDMPISLALLGGLNNPDIIANFVSYADILFHRFGDRVPYWITFNEPKQMCDVLDFHDSIPFFAGPQGPANYVCTNNLLQTHAKIYALYKGKYSHFKGRIGITIESHFAYPQNASSSDDVEAANRALQFYVGQYAHPIFSKTGDYPAIVRKTVDANSKAAGLKSSKLPTLTPAERNALIGSADFYGLNYYTSSTYRSSIGCESCPINDEHVITGVDPSWTHLPVSTNGFYWVPDGLRKILNWIRTEYDNPEVMITENGWSDNGELHDVNRIAYIQSHLNATLNAIADGCNVNAYTTWNFVDDFEWSYGNTIPYGHYKVDFNSTQRTRTAKSSVAYVRKVIQTRLP